MRDRSRDYYDDNYIDGRYSSVKAPSQSLYDDEFWDDDEASWERKEPITVRGGDDENNERYRDVPGRTGRFHAIEPVDDYYDGRRHTARRRAMEAEERRRRRGVEVRGGFDLSEEYWDEDPEEVDESAWEMNRYLKTLPQRTTTKRSVKSSEEAPASEDAARGWRKEPGARRHDEPVYEEAVLDDGPTMPLSIVLLVTAILLTAVAGFGRLHGYQNLSYDWRTQPLLSLVFRGWHDRISPIAALTQDPVAETVRVEDDAADAADDEADHTSEDSADDAADGSILTEETIEVDLNIPDGVNDEVVDAVDYGVCNTAYLASGTTFETLTEGIFAPDGTYLTPQTVDERYLGDALFIGDSRTEGLHLYGNVKDDAYFWCKEALSIYDIYDAEAGFYVPGEDVTAGTTMSLAQALTETSVNFRKIYISIGINELGTPNTGRFYESYKELVSYIREQQPDALIYIQGIMHVSRSYSESDAAFNNTNIVDKNRAIASLANGRDIFYLDMNDKVCDESGDLLTDLSNDGLHLKASAYAIWKESLLSHAFVRDAEDWTAPETVVNTDGTAAGSAGTGGQGTGKPESDISETTGLIVQ